MDDVYDRARHLCRQCFAQRYLNDDEDTLVTCPACDGAKLVRLGDDQNYRVFPCPWCDGQGTTTTQMIAMYRRYQRDGSI